MKKALQDAATVGIPLGDYIDMRFNVPGTTKSTIDKMAEFIQQSQPHEILRTYLQASTPHHTFSTVIFLPIMPVMSSAIAC